METSQVSNNPTLYAKTVANDGQRRQAAEAPVSTAVDRVDLSDQAMQLAKSTKLQAETGLPPIENRQQAESATKNIVEQLRQQTKADAGKLFAVHSGTLKALLA